MSLYTDDILVYLTSPDDSLMETLTEYGNISGYTVNINKIVIILLPELVFNLLVLLVLQWSPNHINYLGLKIPNEMQNTFFLNYTPLLKRQKKIVRNGMTYLCL